MEVSEMMVDPCEICLVNASCKKSRIDCIISHDWVMKVFKDIIRDKEKENE